MDTLSTHTAPEPPASFATSAPRNVALLIGLSVILSVLMGTFSGEKISFLYKDVLHLSASDVGTLGILTGIPGYLRPFMGAGSDLFPLLGFHRRSYYAVSWLLSSLGYFGLSLLHTHHYASVVTLIILTGLGGNLAFVIMDAVMVAIGNLSGSVGRFQTIQQGLPLVMGLTFTGQLGGYVTQYWSYSTCFTASALIALLAVPLTLLIPEQRVSFSQHAHESEAEHQARLEARRAERAEISAALKDAARSPGLWAIVGFVFCLIITPGGNTAQFYYSTTVLHFSKQFLGSLARPGAAGAALGLLLFGFASKRLPVRSLVWGAYFMDCSLYLSSMLLRDHATAIIVAFLSAFLGMIYNLCLLTLAARACPPKIEGAIYGLVIAAIGLAGTLGEKMGASIYDYFGPATGHTIPHGWFTLLWCGLAITVATAIFIPFLPAWAKSSEPLRPQADAAA
ncbi:hypothetical protein CCAX7_12150 [Capsulimonas corticalis]|uniref:Uncharacterized protein n=1 Tax=Capsulimonas corticalis TaxID=2219043 RepID=A0A402D4C6_9BACT|nr:MFS transporter [Capsulimonas corticalis]BDI29164.1 hypothetical protein CCAX7_12150 [Capsulimonas corticalis]